VTGSHPLDTANPCVSHPGLLPTVMSCRTCGFLYYISTRQSLVSKFSLPHFHSIRMSVKKGGTVNSKPQDSKTYKDGVHESHSRLSGFQALVVDARQHGGEDGARGAGAADDGREEFVEDDDVVAHGGDVGVAAAGAVVCSFVTEWVSLCCC